MKINVELILVSSNEVVLCDKSENLMQTSEEASPFLYRHCIRRYRQKLYFYLLTTDEKSIRI